LHKSLQAGTSHFLGQNFARASEIKYQSRQSSMEYAWTTSWGVSTRLIGALIMCHADDDGMIMPPRLAPVQIVILPIIRQAEQEQDILDYCRRLAADLKKETAFGKGIEVHIDTKEDNAGQKSWTWIKKGVPIRVEIGPRDMAAREKKSYSRDEFVKQAGALLEEIQANLLCRATKLLNENTRNIDERSEFYEFFTPKNNAKPEAHGGFAMSHWCGNPECEELPKKDLAVTIRCIPFNTPEEQGECIFCRKPSAKRVVFAKSY